MWVEKRKHGYKFTERYRSPLTDEFRRVSVTLEKDTVQSRKQARKLLQELIDAAIERETAAGHDYALEDLAALYYRHQLQAATASTAERNRISMRTICGLLGPKTRVRKLTAGYINDRFLGSGKAPGTLNEYLTRFKAMFRWAYDNDLVEDIRFVDKLKPYKDIPHRVKIAEKYLERDELAALLDQMKVEEWRLLTAFLALSGLRFGEFCALEKRDVDLDALEIHVLKSYDSVNRVVTDAKTAYSARDVHIQPELLAVVKDINLLMSKKKIRHGIRSRLFMFDDEGEHVHYYAYNKYLKENVALVTGKKITVHALRHTHASLLMEQGLTLDEIARRLGHGSSKITKEVYAHVTLKLRDKDNDRLDSVRILN